MPHTPPSRLRVLRPACLLLPALSLLGGCSSMFGQVTDRFFGLITPYRVEVVQGNVVTAEQLALVKPGMTRDQVRQALGAPLLADPFHAQRWDYVFMIRRQGTEPQQRSLVVFFDGDLVKSIDAPKLPDEREFVASISRKPDADSTRKLELSPEERAALPVPARPEPAATTPAPAPQGAARTYPPLEAR